MDKELLKQAILQNPEIVKKVRVQKITLNEEYFGDFMTTGYIEDCMLREMMEYLKEEGLLRFKHELDGNSKKSVCELLIIDKDKLQSDI